MDIMHLKLKAEFAKEKLINRKPFEIRLNDRNYKKGQLIEYTVPDDEKLNEAFKGRIYQITYVTDFEQKPGYVVFADKHLCRIRVLVDE